MEAAGRICVFCRASIRQLAPRAASATAPRRQWARSIVSASRPHIANTRAVGQRGAQFQEVKRWQYQFSTSARRPAAVLNPRQDEDGNEMEVEITPRAADRLKQIMLKDENPSLALRITVESGGCHGFQYLMSLTDMAQVSREDDTVFEAAEGARIVLDEPSLELLKGSKVDYTMELIGSQFKIVDNPLATSSCGCGTSFDIKA